MPTAADRPQAIPPPPAPADAPAPGHARGRLVALLVAAAVVAVDRITKDRVLAFFAAWRIEHPFERPSVELAGDAVRLTLIHNRGIVFGLLSGGPFADRPWLVAGASAAIFAVLLVYFLRIPPRRYLLLVGLGLVLGGAVGNLIDRVRYGHVVDFIDVSLYFARWYVFNIADAAVVTGAALMAIDLRRPEP